MPNRAKPARLWFQRPRRDAAGRILAQGVWCIRDRGRKRSTGYGESQSREAEQALAEYIAASRALRPGKRHPHQILTSDVISLYSIEVAPKHARPKETAARLKRLLAFFGAKRLSEINGAACRAYVKGRSATAARRELEELRAAINHHRLEGLCSELVSVVLPEKAQPRQRWLSRSEAARLIWAAWRYREDDKPGGPPARFTRRHIARFILIALYTGTRSGAICDAAFALTPGFGHIDTKTGIFVRLPIGRRTTKKRRPSIRLPRRLLVHLRRWERLGQRFPIEWNGEPVETIKRAFRRVTADAGLPGVSPHTLRHTAATWLLQNGVPLWEAAGFVGMSPETLERVYGHHHPEHMQGALDAIDRPSTERLKYDRLARTNGDFTG